MNGFDQINDSQFFVGNELLQVCIGENEVILNFLPDGNRITVFSTSDFLHDNKYIFESLVGSQKRIEQIGKTVTGFSVLSNNIASLAMSDGAGILLKDDSTEFEAVTFRYGGHTIVV